ncbi:MAG: cytidine deaminase [Bacteroidales bacterium]|nr:cytidine deaminase [Bacteroides sp.]MCM1199159.1 cytidine deaminase [Clostridium sp.]MCM1503278.1 cytidine deaminase [Bacteroidales bacterium]
MTNKQINIEYTEFDNLDQLTPEDRELAEKAIEASSRAYSPYSRFSVGAAVRLADGTIVTGSNQENAAYPSGLCAERTAMFYANAQYPDIPMKTLAVVGVKNGKICEMPAAPCGACRQVMAEYQTRGREPFSIILIGARSIWKFERVDDILPFIFDSLDKD